MANFGRETHFGQFFLDCNIGITICCWGFRCKNLGDMVVAPGVHIKILGVDFLYHRMFTLGVFIGFDSSPFFWITGTVNDSKIDGGTQLGIGVTSWMLVSVAIFRWISWNTQGEETKIMVSTTKNDQKLTLGLHSLPFHQIILLS